MAQCSGSVWALRSAWDWGQATAGALGEETGQTLAPSTGTTMALGYVLMLGQRSEVRLAASSVTMRAEVMGAS